MHHIKQSRNPPTKNTQRTQTCRNCGHSWPHPGGKENCPAFNKTCRVCQRQNHFASVCNSTNSRHFNELNNIHTDNSESEDMEAEHIYALRPGVKQSQPRFAVKIHGQNISVLADTGASVNVLDERDFSKLKNVQLTPPDTRIVSYGNNNLRVLGYFHAKAESSTASTYAKFYVIAGSGGSLLGLTTSAELKLANIVQNISSAAALQTAQTRSCLPCQASTLLPSREPLEMSRLPDSPWLEVSADLAMLDTGDYLLVLIDDYSRFPVVEIIPSTSSAATIPRIDKIFCRIWSCEVSQNGQWTSVQ